MIKTYDLEGCQIKIELVPKLIRLHSDADLWKFLANDVHSALNNLIHLAKSDYENHFNKPIQITDDSLITEIVAHVYCDYIGLKFNRFIRIKWIQNLVIKLLERAEIVDCGEKEIDSNRWLWDYLSKYKNQLVKLLPNKLNAHNLK